MNDRLRIPQDNEYFQAIGLAAVAFARLEWEAVWCCEKLQPGYIHTIEPEMKTAGKIGIDLENLFSRVSDAALRTKIKPYAIEFRKVVKERNGLLHGKPATSQDQKQRLFRHESEWTIDAVNTFSDRCVVAAVPLNSLLSNELEVPGAVALAP